MAAKYPGSSPPSPTVTVPQRTPSGSNASTTAPIGTRAASNVLPPVLSKTKIDSLVGKIGAGTSREMSKAEPSASQITGPFLITTAGRLLILKTISSPGSAPSSTPGVRTSSRYTAMAAK